ncbi:hypothetical protein Hanom_Chr08g00720021 [Helianthus anomalus]
MRERQRREGEPVMVVSDRRSASRSGGFCCYPTGPCLEVPVGPIIRWLVRISGEFTGLGSDSVRLSGRIVYSGGRRQVTLMGRPWSPARHDGCGDGTGGGGG